MEQQTNGAVGQVNGVLAQGEARNTAMQRMERSEKGFQLANMDEAWKMATTLAKSGLMPQALQGKPEDILVTLMTGAELGLSPMQSIREIYVVKGKGHVSALLKVALVKQSAVCEYFKMVESSDQVATFETKRRGEGVTRMSFTAKEARQAGLLGAPTKSGEPSNWDKYTALMLRRRCTSMICDEVYPDVTKNVGDVETAADVEAAEARTTSHQMPTTTQAPPKPQATLPRLDTPKQAARVEQQAEAAAEPAPAAPAEPEPTPSPVSEAAQASGAPTEGEVLIAELKAFDPKSRDAAEALAALRARAMRLPKGPERDAVGAALNKAKGLLSGAR